MELCESRTAPDPPYRAIAPGDEITIIFSWPDRLANPMTIQLWAKFAPKTTWPFSGSRYVQTIVSNSSVDPPDLSTGGWLFGVEAAGVAGAPQLFFSSQNSQVFGSELEYDTWYHFAITFEPGSGAARKIYVNGQLDFETVGDESTYADGSDPMFYFTGIWGPVDLRYGGLVGGGITGVIVHSAVLTQSEIQAQYESRALMPCRTADVWAIWTMHDNAWDEVEINPSVAAYDYSPNCRDLLLNYLSLPLPLASDAPILSFFPVYGEFAVTDCPDYVEVPNTEGEDCPNPWTIPTPAAFPMPGIGPSDTPLYSNFNELAPDWGNFGHSFPDKKPAHNTIQSARTRRFEIQYEGLNEAQAAVLDDHYDSTKGALKFDLTHPRTLEELEGVRYEAYERDTHIRKWSQRRTVRLIQTPFA